MVTQWSVGYRRELMCIIQWDSESRRPDLGPGSSDAGAGISLATTTMAHHHPPASGGIRAFGLTLGHSVT